MMDFFFLFAESGSSAALVTFLIYILAVFGLAWLSNRLLRSKSFLSEYFLGSRGLGVWAFALTFAATSASGGSFTGFPSKIYTHGWVLGLWIGSYIVVPICAMGLLGKRINQVARISGAITVPDVLRDRFRNPWFGLLSVALIIFFMSFNLVGQFKAGSEILNTLLRDVPLFKTAVASAAPMTQQIDVAPDYFLCLVVFAIAVIVYTTYGGFHAVVWTDVMQGVVMVAGVGLMLPLALSQVGGLESATSQMRDMKPPRVALVNFELEYPLATDYSIPSPWFQIPGEDGDLPRLFRVSRSLTIPRDTRSIKDVRAVEIRTPDEIRHQLGRLTLSDGDDSSHPCSLLNADARLVKEQQLAWLEAESGDADAIAALRSEISATDDNTLGLLNSPDLGLVQPELTVELKYSYGDDQTGVYVTGPGPSKPPSLPDTADDHDPDAPAPESNGFLPLSLAISFFFMWAISGSGQPSSMVRLMAFNSSQTLRRAIFTVAIYYSMIYFPLVIIFCCARVILPGMDLESDRIMPQMAVTLTGNIGHVWLAGLLVAAPFAAVMSTVDSFLLMISSALVRDIYQRNVNPDVQEKTIKIMSYVVTLLVGAAALLGAMWPTDFLQDIIVYTGSGLAACFLAPMVYALYWPRINAVGCIAGMLAGFAAHLSMYVTGLFVNGSFFSPYQLFNFNPIIVGLLASFATTYVVAKVTPPPPEDLVRKYFYKKPPQDATA